MPRLITAAPEEMRRFLQVHESRGGRWKETVFGWHDPETKAVLRLRDAYRLAWRREQVRNRVARFRARLSNAKNPVE